MDWISRNQKLLTVIAAMFAGVTYWAAFELLLQSLISGSEFVTLVIAATATSLIIVFAPSIQEVSIGGNIIKLKEAKVDADETLKKLNNARVSMLVATLSSLRRSKPDFNESSSGFDDRASYFLSLYDANKDLLNNAVVAEEFRSGSEHFITESMKNINHHCRVHPNDGLGHRPSPDQLESWYAKNRGAGGEVDSVPLQFVEYRKLTEISERLKSRR